MTIYKCPLEEDHGTGTCIYTSEIRYKKRHQRHEDDKTKWISKQELRQAPGASGGGAKSGTGNPTYVVMVVVVIMVMVISMLKLIDALKHQHQEVSRFIKETIPRKIRGMPSHSFIIELWKPENMAAAEVGSNRDSDKEGAMCIKGLCVELI